MLPLLLSVLFARSVFQPDVLANVRKAIAVPPGGSGWSETVLTGTAHLRGVDNRYELKFQPGGAYRQSVLGKLGQTMGYDGRNFWEIDASGATRHLAFEDVDRVQTVLFLLTDHWLDAGAPVDIAVDPNPPKNGQYTLHLTYRVSGLEELVRVDAKSWLPSSAEFDIAASKTSIVLSNWHAAGSQKVPFEAKVTDEGLTDTYQVTDAVRSKSSEASVFSIPEMTPKDLTYDASIPASVETKRAASGHILLHPRINGKDIGWFILDSGADCMIVDKAAADTLALPQIGKEAVMGVGGAVQEPFRTAAEFSLGPATMKDVNFLEIDMHGLSDLFNVKLAGIVGFDFFRRFIVQVDLKKPSVEIDNVSDFHLQRGDWSKMEFSSGNPAVQATFEGDHKGWFRLDTGANGKVVFHAPTVEKLKLLEGREATPVGMAGVGGTTDAKMGKMAWFELGGHRFENLDAVFSLAKVGAFADRYLTGNIGQDLMEPFTVVFDFGGSRVAFLPH